MHVKELDVWESLITVVSPKLLGPGSLMWSFIDPSFSRSQLHAPCVGIGTGDADFIKQLMATSNSVVTVILSSEDPNPWGDYFSSTSFLLIQLFLVLISVIAFAAAVHRIVLWWRSSQKLGRTAWAVLILEMLGNLERVIYTGMRLFS